MGKKPSIWDLGDYVPGFVPPGEPIPEELDRPAEIPNQYEAMLLGVTTPAPSTIAPSTQAPVTGQNDRSQAQPILRLVRPGPDPLGNGGKHNVAVVPPERQCPFVLNLADDSTKVCGGWTWQTPEGPLDQCCFNHSTHPTAIAQRQANTDAAAKKAAIAHTRPRLRTLDELMDVQAKTQDDISAKRTAIQKALAAHKISPSEASTLLRAIAEESEHIERYGAIQGAEGGQSYMRLMPGMNITEYEDPRDAVLDEEDVDKIDAGMAKDVAKGITPPTDMADIIAKYCGRKVRKREKSRYDHPGS